MMNYKSQVPNPNQNPMTKLKIPNQCQSVLELAPFWGFGHCDLGFDWDLGPWSLGFFAIQWSADCVMHPITGCSALFAFQRNPA
jgi:hypothetical protein